MRVNPGKLFGIFTTYFLIILSSCGEEPRDDEMVIRSEDFETSEISEHSDLSVQPPVEDGFPSGDILQQQDTVIAVDTVSIDTTFADTVFTDVDTDSIADLTEVFPELAEQNFIDTDQLLSLAIEINGSLYSSIGEVCEEDPDILAAHCSRIMWWEINPQRDLIAGDSIYLVCYKQNVRTDMENRVIALRYVPVRSTSNNMFTAYSFLREGDNFPSYYYQDGREVNELLNQMPLSTFEEITGIYGEIRGSSIHEGVDFKAPQGTPVKTIRGGTVTRIDWNTDYNGHCVEINIGAGYSEIFIHLYEIEDNIYPGAVISAGAVIGSVGNTGRSYNAHLHYQINDNNTGYSIDPYLFLGSYRRQLSEEDMIRFLDHVRLYDSFLNGEQIVE